MTCFYNDTILLLSSGDGQKLYNDFQRSREQPILPRGLIDLSELARCVHTEDLLRKYGTGMISMQRLVSIYLDRYLVRFSFQILLNFRWKVAEAVQTVAGERRGAHIEMGKYASQLQAKEM